MTVHVSDRALGWVGSLVGGIFVAALAHGSAIPVCVGDCSGDGEVAVNELIRGVNIALGNMAVSACPVLDADSNGRIAVNELILAVNNALNNCTTVPTATPTSTPAGGTTPTPGNGGACTEDASAFVSVSVESIQVLDRNSPCGVIAPTLQTRASSVMFTNTHPSRRIAIAAIIIFQSDKRTLPRSPCEYAIQGGAFSSLEECHEGIAAGCESPVGLFLDPGQTSGEFFYNCKEESLFPGSGVCGEMSLETTTATALAHAVFCDDFDAAQANFCSAVHTSLLDTGQPVSGFAPITTDDCP